MAYELHQAAERGQLGELVKLLVLGVADQAADIHAKNEAGETPIHCAVRSGRIETIIYLLCHGADVNAKVESTAERPGGETPLHMACSLGNTQIARHFLVSGADVNAKTNFNSAGLGGDTPLHLACASGSLEVTRLLLNSGADPNAANRLGWTPLHIAARNGHLKIAEELVCRVANPAQLCDAANIHPEAKQTSDPTPETATVPLPQSGGETPPTAPEQQPSPMSSGEAKATTEGKPETMSFLKQLFGGGKTPSPPISYSLKNPESVDYRPTDGGPHLPSLLKNPDSVDFSALFSQHSPEVLARLCQDVPVEQLVLYHYRDPSMPGKTMSDSMADLVTACFRLATVITKRDADPQCADIFIPRLIKRIEEHDPQKIIPLAWEPIRDLALDLIRGKRNREALRCLSYVKQTILGSSWTNKDHGGAFWTFAAHANIGWTSKNREEIQSALDLVGTLKGTELQEMRQIIDGLKTRLAAL